jgi:hypothetical protein
MALILAGTLLALIPAGAGAEPAAQSANQCFLSSSVDGFNAPDDHTVYIRAGVKDVYRLDLMSDCIGLKFRNDIGLERSPGSSWICSPLDAQIVYRDVGMPERCPVTAIHKLSADEITALPKGDRP